MRNDSFLVGGIVSPIMDVKQASSYLHLSVVQLQVMRRRGEGPPFVRLSGRRIGYLRADIDAWLESRRATKIGEEVRA